MGDMADAMIDGLFDFYTGEYLDDDAPGYPRYVDKYGNIRPVHRGPLTEAEKKVKAIRKELAILIQEKHKTCVSEKDKNRAVEGARQEINKKYGKGWRELGSS